MSVPPDQPLAAGARDSRATAERLQHALHAARIGLWDWDIRANTVYFSPEWKRQLGYEDQEIPSEFGEWERRVHSDDRSRALETIRTFVAKPWPDYRLEFRLRHKDGSYRWILAQASLEHDAAGRVIRVLGSHIDITEHKEVEQALRESEERFRRLIEHAPEAVVLLDMTTGTYIQVNPAAEQLYKMSAAQLCQTGPIQMSPPRQPDGRLSEEKGRELLGRTLAGETPVFEWMHRNGAGDDILCEVRLLRLEIGGRDVIRGSVTDISERKRTETALRERERELRLITDSLPGPVSRVDREQRYLFVNEQYERVFGRSREAVVGHTLQEVLGEDFFQYIEPYVCRVLAGELVTFESQTPAPEGGFVHWLVTYVPDRDPDRQVVGFFVIALDITARKRSEDELHWRTAFFEAQVDSAIDGILVVDGAGKKILQNRRMNELWKLPPHIAEDKDDARQVEYVLSQVRDPQAFGAKVAHLYSHPDEVSRDEITLVDGTILERFSSPVRGRTGKHYGRIWTFRDITERRHLEEQVRHSQKMESVGQLAGGVAHDFNNILTVIQGHVSLLVLEGEVSAAARESIEEIRQAADRAANLTRQLLTFSRRQAMRADTLDLNGVVTNMARLLQRILGEDVSLELHLASHDIMVHADAGMIEQVLLNLAVNSRDAMPRGGRLVIETAAVEFDESIASRIPSARPGAFVCLATRDTGVGIAPEVLPHIFEPFFTTKEPGKGTGLGLATVYGIVQQHEGWIDVESELKRGTTFKVYLPRLSGAATASPVLPPPDAARGRGETILLAEDEPAVRALVHQLLERFGYKVLAAATGHRAMDLWRDHREAIDLVITDLVMPDGMSGFDLGAQLALETPGLRLIYTSGYSPELAGRGDELVAGVNFLAKPFEMDALLRTVRRALDRPRAR